MTATAVELSSGETFYVDAGLEKVADALSAGHLVRIGSRFVNGSQVTQIVRVPDVSSIHTPEHLEEED